MEYKSLKPITLKAIVESGVDYECGDFRTFARRVVREEATYGYAQIPVEMAQSIATHMGYSTWFLDHGFIERVQEERFWSIGDRIMLGGDEHIIAHVMDKAYGFIAIETGFSWSCSRHQGVEDSRKITLTEMRRMGYVGE